MREIRNTKIIAVDHGYGNIKTANTVTPTGITAYETEPIFTGKILEYNGTYYRIGEGHKEFIPDKAMDEDYYRLTLMAVARELNVFSIHEADVHLAAGLPLKNEGWTDESGHVFLYFTIESMAEVLHKSQGAGHPNRIYVKFPEKAFFQTDNILSIGQTENCPADRQDSFPETDRKLSGNKKERNKNDLSKRESQEKRSPYGNFQNVFLSEKELEELKQAVPDWLDYIERLSGYMASTGKQYQNHAATIISWARQDRPPARQRNYESEEYETL